VECRVSKNAKKVLEKRYLLKDDKGKVIETTEHLFRRVAKTVVSVEKNKKDSEQNNCLHHRKIRSAGAD